MVIKKNINLQGTHLPKKTRANKRHFCIGRSTFLSQHKLPRSQMGLSLIHLSWDPLCTHVTCPSQHKLHNPKEALILVEGQDIKNGRLVGN